MPARIIDGKAIAAELRAAVAAQVQRLAAQNLVPGLAVVLVGENPASAVYVRNKSKQTVEAGMRSFDHKLPEDAPEREVLALVGKLNADPTVHGILVQLPLPKQIDSQKVLNAIDPAKDVDGFHPVNAGRLSTGLPALTPGTPLGCIHLAKSVHPSLEGMEAVVVGRSNIVGKPLLQLLLNENATVTVAFSASSNWISGLPTMFERPTMTASMPSSEACTVLASITQPSGVQGVSAGSPVASRPALTG